MKLTLKNILFKAGIAFVLLIVFNVLISGLHWRWDLTKDKRYTLSESTQNTIAKIKTPVVIDVLLSGDIPADFQKLQTETRQLLEEYSALNNNIHFNFIDPLADEPDTEKALAELASYGLTPLQIAQTEAGKSSIAYIFPWAMVSDGEQSEKVSLFANKLGATDQERVQHSVQRLEYNFTDAFHKLTLEKKKKIAVLKSNGTLENIQIADFLRTEQNYYRIAPFTLDSVQDAKQAEATLKALNEFDLLIVSKPTKPFTDAQKQVIDQYVMQGGNTLWLVDFVNISIEDLYNPNGSAIAMPMDLNLGDLFFQYGVRVNYDLVNDLYFTQIVIASGEGNETRYLPIPWVYNPMILSKNSHVINQNLDAIRLQFASTIDTLKNNIKKTVLLSSSALSKADGTPRAISLDVSPDKLDKNAYVKGNFPVAVLLEGHFTSVYKNRVLPLDISNTSEAEKPAKMIVISDGDFIKNEVSKGNPLELGFDKWTNKFYDNKLFLQNTVNYLLDETDFLSLRNKKVQLAFLDKEKVAEKQSGWKLKSILIPLVLLFILLIAIQLGYKKRYIR